MARIIPLLFLLLAHHAPAASRLVLSFGNPVVPEGTSSHSIDIVVSGDAPLTDMVLKIQIGDGGPLFNPNGTPGPRLVGIDLAGSLWSALPGGPMRGDLISYPTQLQELSIAVAASGQQIVANGRLCRLHLDLSGFTGSFPLRVTATLAGDSAFEYNGQPVSATLTNGTLFIGDSPPPAPAPIPRVTIERQPNGSVVLKYPSETGSSYTVEWSASLNPPWNRLASTTTQGTGGFLQWTDDGSLTGIHPSLALKRFYRIAID